MSTDNLPQQTSQRKLPESYKTNRGVMELVSKYGEDFVVSTLMRYPSVNRLQTVPSLMDAVRQESQSLVRNRLQYSREHTLFWIKRQLIEVFQFVGCFKSMTDYQVRQCAELILNDEILCTITLSEFMQFCERFKKAKYDTFFSNAKPNPQDFFKAISAFFRDLQTARDKYEKEKQAEKEKRESKGITWQEYCKITGRDITENPLSNIKLGE
jgi:hypothetical protein